MILKQFIKGSIGQIIVIVLMAALLWVRAFIDPVGMKLETTLSPIYEQFYMLLSPMPLLASGIALCMVLVQGVWLNIMLSNHKITNINSLLPLLLYLIAMSWDAQRLTITPTLLVNFMMIGACGQLLSDGSASLPVSKVFNASFLIGIAVMCHLPAICFLLPLIFVFVTYKLYRWRDIVASVLGFIAPFIVMAIYLFMTDKLHYFQILSRHDLTNLHVLISSPGSLVTATNAIILTLLLISLVWHARTSGDKVMYQRINAKLMTLPLLASAAMMLYESIFPIDIQTLSMPFAYLMTLFLFVKRKRQWIGEALLWIIIICAVL